MQIALYIYLASIIIIKIQLGKLYWGLFNNINLLGLSLGIIFFLTLSKYKLDIHSLICFLCRYRLCILTAFVKKSSPDLQKALELIWASKSISHSFHLFFFYHLALSFLHTCGFVICGSVTFVVFYAALLFNHTKLTVKQWKVLNKCSIIINI